MSNVARGPVSRGVVSSSLFEALHDRYSIRGSQDAIDLGGSSNLNLLLVDGGHRYVVRVYRPWITTKRIADIQLVRQLLASDSVPCVQPITTVNGDTWIEVDNRLVEVEPYVEYDSKMDSWLRLEKGLPLLGRIHMLLQDITLSEDGHKALAANYIEPQDVLIGTFRGTQHIRRWDATPSELQLAASAEELAQLVYQAQSGIEELPRQLVHGDYWDNNVCFRDGRIVLIADLDFMGERARIDDLALTLYYTNSTFSDDQISDERIQMLRILVNAYDAGLNETLTSAERAALPVALARTSLAFIAMIPDIDSETGARQMAAKMTREIPWALAIMRDLNKWQSSFVGQP